jgi:hypothetical protein
MGICPGRLCCGCESDGASREDDRHAGPDELVLVGTLGFALVRDGHAELLPQLIALGVALGGEDLGGKVTRAGDTRIGGWSRCAATRSRCRTRYW